MAPPYEDTTTSVLNTNRLERCQAEVLLSRASAKPKKSQWRDGKLFERFRFRTEERAARKAPNRRYCRFDTPATIGSCGASNARSMIDFAASSAQRSASNWFRKVSSSAAKQCEKLCTQILRCPSSVQSHTQASGNQDCAWTS